MMLIIDVDEENIIKNSGGRIVVKLDYYSKFSKGAWLCSVDGNTLEDLDKNIGKKSGSIFVGRSGGITLER